jgi:hypothetical protein
VGLAILSLLLLATGFYFIFIAALLPWWIERKREEITLQSFWETDLEDIEETFLPKGKKITDLPIKNSINGITE